MEALQRQEWPWDFFEITGSILLALDGQGKVTYINRKGAEILGRPPGQIIGRDWFESFIPDRLRNQVRAVFRQICAGASNAPAQFENAVLCQDGSERIISWRNAVARDASGSIVGGLASGEDVTEQRRAEAALRESEARFRATFEQAAVGMAHVGLDGRFLRLNDKLCEITRYTRAELETRTFGDITHADDLEAEIALAEALREGKIPHYTMERCYIRKDGSTVWVKLTGSLVSDPQGRPDYFIAVVDDITLRKQAERLLADEELQRMALSCAEAGAWQWEAAGSMNWMAKTYEIFGLDPAEGPPKFYPWLERCVHQDDHHYFEDALRRAAEAGSSDFRIVFRCPHPRLGLRWVTSVGRVITDEDRSPARAYGIVLDVTANRELEQRLHASEERLRMAMEAGSIGVWDWDVVSGRINRSENFGSLLGIQPADFPTTVDGFRELVHPGDRQVVWLALEQALGGEAEYNQEFRMVGPDGRVRWTESRAIVLRDHAGQPIRMIGIDRDISAQKSAEERQERLIGELDHRVRNLLTLAQSLARQSLTAGPERDRFIGRLLALGKAHGLLRNEGESADLLDIVAQEMEPFGPERVSIQGPRLDLSARAVQTFALALHELTTNAVKYGALSCAGGKVAVDWSVDEGLEPMLDLRWTECAGPVVRPPERTGFGTRLLMACLKEFRGAIELSFPPEGLRARLSMPLDGISKRSRGRERPTGPKDSESSAKQ